MEEKQIILEVFNGRRYTVWISVELLMPAFRFDGVAPAREAHIDFG